MHRDDQLYSAESVLHQIEILFSEQPPEKSPKKRKSKDIADFDDAEEPADMQRSSSSKKKRSN